MKQVLEALTTCSGNELQIGKKHSKVTASDLCDYPGIFYKLKTPFFQKKKKKISIELNSICHFTLELGKQYLGNILATKSDSFLVGRLLAKTL